MDTLTKILERDGPCLTSELAQKVANEYGISNEAARQRVTRRSEGINTLAYMPFQRNSRFIYLKKDFGSPRYWNCLIKALIDNNSAYGFALAALKVRNGIVPLHCFPSVSGAPKRLKKHLSPETILDRLKKAKLVETIEISGIGTCVALIQGDKSYYSFKYSSLNARIVTESIILNAIKAWAKNTGLVSYDKIAIRGDNQAPEVATIEWDFSAPSYLSCLSKRDGEKTLPGFVVCDVALHATITENAVKAFLSKCKIVRSLQKAGSCMQILVASDFEKSAFILAKKNGIMPVTPEALFGDEVGEAITILADTIIRASDFIFDPEILTKVYDSLSVFEGAVGRIRGAYFEIFVMEVMRRYGYLDVRMNQILKLESGDSTEIDVIAINSKEILFIECKGYSPHTLLSEKEVDKWLNTRIPRAFQYAKNHPDWKKLSIRMELWTTSDVTTEMESKIKNFADSINPRRYEISFKNRDDVIKSVAETNTKSLIQSFEGIFLTDPLMKARSKITKPRFGGNDGGLIL